MALTKQIYLPTGGSASFHVLTGWQDYPRCGDSDVTISSWMDQEAYQDGTAPVSAQTIRIKTSDIRAQFVKNLGNPETYDDEVEEAVRLFVPEFEGATWSETPERLADLKARLIAGIKDTYARLIGERYTEAERAHAETTLNRARLPTESGVVPPTEEEVFAAKSVREWCAQQAGAMKSEIDAVMAARSYRQLAGAS